MERPKHQPKPYFSDIMIPAIWMPLAIVLVGLLASFFYPYLMPYFHK